MEKFFQKETQETETVNDVTIDDELEQEQQSSIIISPSPHE
jgi:anthranilate/para-aminobenzoate synthase component II